MKELVHALANFAERLPWEQRERLAQDLRNVAPGVLSRVVHEAWIPNNLEYRRLRETLEKELRRFPRLGGETLALALATASEALRLRNARTEKIELVWSGPDSKRVPVRPTEEVLLELFRGAKARLFIVSFVVFDVPSLFDELKKASNRGVEVSCLFEPAKDHGGSVNVDSFSNFKKAIPNARLFQRADLGYKKNAKVHAKCAVADEDVAFVTSANITEVAMRVNVEIGTLIRGGRFPKQLHDLLESLVLEKIIVPF